MKAHVGRRLLAVSLCAACVCGRVQSAPDVLNAEEAAPSVGADLSASGYANAEPASYAALSPEKATLTYAGQAFELAQSRPGERLSTDEYTLPGEKLGEWTQLVTVQRLAGTAPANPEQLVQFFRLRLKSEEATLDLLAETEKGRAFVVRFPARGTTEEQVMICLAFVDPTQRQVLNVVQYAVKPHRVGAQVAATQLRAWKERLVAQTLTR